MSGEVAVSAESAHSGRSRSSMRRDTKGASLIEFGIAAPLIGFLIMILADSTLGFAQKAVLERAASRTIERVTAFNGGDATYNTLRQEAATASGQDISQVTVERYLECDRERETAWPGSCPAGEEIGRYVKISITRTYVPMFNAAALASFYGGASTLDGVVLTGDAVVRLQ